MTALRIAELATEAGLPQGVLNVLPGAGSRAGESIGRHDGVQVVSFTGSTEIGRRFLEYSAQSNLKRIVLECGGKNPAVVLSDAANIDHVARQITYAALWNMGQNCTANSRVIVHKNIKKELTERIGEQMRSWKTGDPLDPANRLGAIVDAEQHKKILALVETGKKEGARVLKGGKAFGAGGGLFIEPTLFDRVESAMTVAQEEIFGPVLAIIEVDSDARALAVANDTPYGLQASLFTADVTKAHRFARALQAGTVSVNCYSEGDATTPFGGYKLSGFGGRDNSLQAHDQYCETKTIWLDIGDDPIDDSIAGDNG